MRYIFKVLILGDPNVNEFYALRAFEEPGEDKETYVEWYKEVRVLDDVCDLEIDVVTSLSADLDDLLPMVDGIIYFLNPQVEGESELFEMILPDIFSVKRDIPTIVIFYDQNGILPLSVNEILENVWVNFPSLEAFVNLLPRDFHQVLQSLSLAMINGDSPLNIENAWMRFPIFIQMANIYYDNKNYYYAAQAVKKASMIAEIYNKEEYFIISEQAAFLYSKMNLYLEASKILEKIDKIKSKNYKNLYADAMIREGNLYFNRKKFNKAARQYERTAQWSSIESLDSGLINDAFKLGINSWISACKVEYALKILDNLPHKLVLEILKEISKKIQDIVNYLIENNDFEQAREQLSIAVNKYQREVLFEDLKGLTSQLSSILIHIFNQFVDDGNFLAAKNIYDEVENLWEVYKVEKTNLDSTLEKLISGFLNRNDFETSSTLINKLSSRTLRQNLTKVRDEYEDRHSVLIKEEHSAYINKGIEILREFFEAEIDIIIKMNTKIIEEAEILSTQGDFLKASIQLKNQAKYLKTLGKAEIKDQILTKSLDLSLEGIVFKEFFKNFDGLSDDMKKKYLIRVFPKFIQKLKELQKIDDYKEKEQILEKSNKIFRNQMLYEESKDISLIYIDVIKRKASEILENEGKRSGIIKAEKLIKRAINISESYLEKIERSKISYDKIFKKIAEIFIELEDLPSANAYNDKIENKNYKNEIHKEIEKLESHEIATASKRVENLYKAESLKEQASMIKKRGKEALKERKNELKKRKTLKRSHFKEALEKINLKEYGEACELYKESILKLNNIQKYNLAGVSLAVACFLLILMDDFNEIAKLLVKIKKSLSSLGRLFSETYPVTLITYIIDLKKFHDKAKIKEAIVEFENLPLFEEELVLIYDYLGKDYKDEQEVREEVESKVDITEVFKEIQILASSIQKDKQDVGKRKLMKNQYWKQTLVDLSENKMGEAYTGYLDSIPKLIEKKFFKHTVVSLILALVIQIKEGGNGRAKDIFEKIQKEKKSEFDSLPEFKIVGYLINAIENNDKRIATLIINHFLEKLILFDPEVDFLENFIGQEITKEKHEPQELSRKELGNLKKLKIDMDQKYSKIKSLMVDIPRERILKNRNAMRRRYYNDILKLLESHDFKDASVKYYDLAKMLANKKDFETGSLLILLYGLVLIKAGEPIKSIKKNIQKFLDGLGLNKKLVKETYYIMVISFILDVNLNNLDKNRLKIKKILEILPLFEEEKDLIELEL